MRRHLLFLGLCSIIGSSCGSGQNQPSPNGPACTPSGGIDSPQLTAPFTDENCDGIDGDISKAIFVSESTGNDANAGDIKNPTKSISAALVKAKATGKSEVYVSKGTYLETVFLPDGISLYGTYSATDGWKRDLAYQTVVQSNPIAFQPSVALEAKDILSPTTVSQITFHASTGDTSTSTYGARIINAPRLILDHTRLIADAGAPGKNGITSSAPPAPDGTAGSIGFNCSTTPGVGGDGGGQGAAKGGKGGNGGYPSNGQAGESIPLPGGAGGTGGTSGTPGQNGKTPVKLCLPIASIGHGGNGGEISVTNDWVSAPGTSGASGISGAPGSGGGGSSAATYLDTSRFPPIFVTIAGNGGGGGGSGGTGGVGGQPGIGGGASIAALVINTSGLIIQDCVLQSSNGGSGGTGADGGPGSAGGIGGPGGTTSCGGKILAGGNGGNGSGGCFGAGGGGGAGGPSYALYRHQSTVSLSPSSSLSHGSGGLGGIGGNNGLPTNLSKDGSTGLSAPIF